MLVWTGNDNNDKINSSYSKITKNIWADTIENILKDKDDIWYDKPQNVNALYLDPITGENVDDQTGVLFYFLKGTEPVLNN